MRLIWNEEIMKKSFEFIKRLVALDINFILIGGWAVYFLTKYHMSKDIDMFIEERDVWKLKNYMLGIGGSEKVTNLNKYGFAFKDVELDVYTESKSGLIIPVKEVFGKNLFQKIEDIKVLKPEYLLLLKTVAAEKRQQSIKGFKDRCDILALCTKANVDFLLLRHICESYKIENLLRTLEKVIMSLDREFEFVFEPRPTPSKMKKIKRNMIVDLKRLS